MADAESGGDSCASPATVTPTSPQADKVCKQSSHGATTKHIPTELSKPALLHTEHFKHTFHFRRVIFVTEVRVQHLYPCKENIILQTMLI